jgi:hypothetical protein
MEAEISPTHCKITVRPGATGIIRCTLCPVSPGLMVCNLFFGPVRHIYAL